MSAENVVFDQRQLDAAMRDLGLALAQIRTQLGTGPSKAEAKAVIREKARTGSLKPLRAPQATAPRPRQTGPVRPPTGVITPPPAPEATGELEAVDGWESLSDLAAQNRPVRKRKPQ